MNVHRFSVGELQANCYLLEKNKHALLIDPGDSADTMLEYIVRHGLTLCGLVATHGHFDHIGAVGELQIAFPQADLPLYIHADDEFLVKRVKETARHFLGYEAVLVEPQKRAPLTNPLIIGEFSLEVIATPGHTPGSVCFYLAHEGILFSGDTLFAGAVGRYDFSYSNKAQLKASLQKLSQLPEETVVHPGHGETTFIGHEIVRGTMDMVQ